MPVDLNDLGRFGRYQLIRRISLGGMAEVYKAKSYGEHGFEKVVALKRILPSVAESERFVEMFVQEARVAACLDHPNVCRIFELGREGDSYYITMEFIYGHDLREVMRRQKATGRPMDPWTAAAIVADVASALDHAWQRDDGTGSALQLVHRDVSPQNIMISFGGVVKLIDFGIAKVPGGSQTAGGVLKGKYPYMSPEHADSRPLDARADIWSLGVVFHELLSGRRLFAGVSVPDTIEQVLTLPIPPLEGAPPELVAIIERMLERDLEKRFESHADVLAALDAALRAAPLRPGLSALMDGWFPEAQRLESDLSESDVRLVLSAEERGEETTDIRSDIGNATQIFLADSTGQGNYRAVLEALLAGGRLSSSAPAAPSDGAALVDGERVVLIGEPPPPPPPPLLVWILGAAAGALGLMALLALKG